MTDSNMSDSSRQGSSMTSDLKDAAGQTYEDVRTKALDAVSRTTEAARSQAMEQAEVAKSTLADTAERLAQSVRQSVDSGDQSVQGKLMFAAADAISDMSNSLRGQSFQDLVGQVQSFARRNPGAFVAAAAAAGFALARFARSSATPPAPSYNDQYGSQYGSQSFGSSGSSYGSSSYGSGQGSSSGMGSSYGSGIGSSAMGGGMSSGTGYGSGTGDMGGSSSTGSFGSSSLGGGSGSGMGSGGSYAGTGSLGAGTGTGYGSGRPAGSSVSTSGMSTHDDLEDEAGSIADDGMGGGTASGTPNSTSDRSGTGYDR